MVFFYFLLSSNTIYSNFNPQACKFTFYRSRKENYDYDQNIYFPHSPKYVCIRRLALFLMFSLGNGSNLTFFYSGQLCKTQNEMFLLFTISGHSMQRYIADCTQSILSLSQMCCVKRKISRNSFEKLIWFVILSLQVSKDFSLTTCHVTIKVSVAAASYY